MVTMRNCFVYVFLMTLFPGAVILAQSTETERFSKRIENIAVEYYRIGDYKKALEGYLMLDSVSPGNTYYNHRIGICYLNSSQKSKAFPYLEFAYQQEDAPDNILFDLARAYHYGLEFDKAIIMYESFRKQIQYQQAGNKSIDITEADIATYIQQCRNGKRFIANPELHTRVENLGPDVNSSYTDFGPLINRQEDLLIFTSKRGATENTKPDPLTGQFYENVFVSRYIDGSWEESFSIGEPINQDQAHNAAVGLSPDGKLLFLYKGDDSFLSSRVSGNLYLSRISGGLWQDPEKIEVINTKSWESSASITEDGTMLVFSSDRPGGFGGTDLYMSKKMTNGAWGTPQNLGGYINTTEDEDGPFIHPEGNKLYFSSKGHDSMGGYDIFYSEYLEDKKRWTRPVNMGFPINSADDDIFFVWSADGNRAYFSSEREDSYGETDIYLLTLSDDKSSMITVRTEIRDKLDQSAVNAKITVREKLNNRLIGLFDTSEEEGSTCAIPLRTGRNYQFSIDAKGYRMEVFDVDLAQTVPDEELIQNVTLTRNQ